MKAIKKWLFDKEGLFIIITWWSIALVIFSIILGTSIKGVVSNSKITADTIDGYVHEFIEQGDNITPYNENVVSTAVGIQNGEYFLNVREYAHRYTKPCSEKFEISGTGTGITGVWLITRNSEGMSILPMASDLYVRHLTCTVETG